MFPDAPKIAQNLLKNNKNVICICDIRAPIADDTWDPRGAFTGGGRAVLNSLCKICKRRLDIYIKSCVHKLPWQLQYPVLNVFCKFIFAALNVSENVQWFKIGQIMNNVFTY